MTDIVVKKLSQKKSTCTFCRHGRLESEVSQLLLPVGNVQMAENNKKNKQLSFVAL